MQNQNSQQEIFCAKCGSRKKTRYCEICKEETPNSFKKNLPATIRPKPTLGRRIKRGKESWNFIRWIFAIVLSVIISILPIYWLYKFFIFLVLFWLFFFNTNFQKWIIKLKTKIEDWRKI